MTDRSATTTPTPRRGVLRLVVLALTLAGFVTMHGLAAADAGPAHCGLPAALLLTDGDAHPSAHPSAHQPMGHHDNALVGEHGMRAAAPAPARDSDELMIGCLLALLGTLAAIGLRLVSGPHAGTASASARRALAWLRPARAPPDPLFLSLCVFRL